MLTIISVYIFVAVLMYILLRGLVYTSDKWVYPVFCFGKEAKVPNPEFCDRGIVMSLVNAITWPVMLPLCILIIVLKTIFKIINHYAETLREAVNKDK